MSRLNLAPNFVTCTVLRARNLPNKGKTDGINPFCTIGMGKDKFATAVREKTCSPDWQEQCDMQIVDDATIKLTVYHNTKNALSKGDFIGRAYVSLRDLQDYDRVHTNWYRLVNKEGKADKDRGEIEVSLQFYSKNNSTGSVLDLTTKKKHLSLKDIKQSLGGKFKSASKHRKNDSFSSDNQLADQRSRLEGGAGSIYNVPDFLDDSASETTSYAGSQFSLNSMSQHGQQKKHVSIDPPLVKRKIQPREDLTKESVDEIDHKLPISTPSSIQRQNNQILPDIVGKGSNASTSNVPMIVKPTSQPLAVLGYTDVKSTPVNPKIRQELDNLDREELLHVIAHQSALLKKRDTRVKDLEQYADGLLIKIVEQCPTILQVRRSASFR